MCAAVKDISGRLCCLRDGVGRVKEDVRETVSVAIVWECSILIK